MCRHEGLVVSSNATEQVEVDGSKIIGGCFCKISGQFDSKGVGHFRSTPQGAV